MNKILITVIFAASILQSFGQSQREKKVKVMRDSITTKYIDAIALKNPVMRQAGISTEVFAPGRMKSDLNGNSFFKSRYRTVRTNAYFTIPIAHVKNNIFSTSFAVSHQTMQIYDVVSIEASLPVGTTIIHNTLLSTSFSYTRIDSLFHRPVAYSTSVSGLMNPETKQYRIGFIGVMSLTLLQTKNSTLSVGVMVLLDPSVPSPLIPFISYYHKFKSPGLEFFLDPSRIALRKELNSKSSISLTNNIGANLSLFRHDITNMPIKQAYSTLEMKSGLTFEHLLAKKMVFTISGGISSTLTSKVLEQNKSKDPFIKSTQSMVPYIKMGVSFLPFWKGIIH